MPLIRDRARRALVAVGHNRVSDLRTIKVVKFKSSTAEWPIKVKLKTIDSHTTKYIALSYVNENDFNVSHHGNSSTDSTEIRSTRAQVTQTILCDGTPTKVTQSLWDALNQLRCLNSDVPIWVDRLCIDFEDRDERAAQVNIMGNIYHHASHVIVWLGKKTRGTDDAILCMRKLVNAIDWRKLPQDFAADLRDAGTYTRLGMDRISVQQWNNIHHFCHARWFSRLWPFFELASAKQSIFLVGNCYMDYDFLMDFAMVLGLTGWFQELSQIVSGGYDEDSIGLTKMLGPVATLRSIPVWHPAHQNHTIWMRDEYGLDTEEERAWMFLEILLRNSERFECQDDHDRILAPLAYVRMAYTGKAVNQSWPNIDYDTSIEITFAHFAEIIQRHTHRPSILATEDRTYAQRTPPRPVQPRGRAERRALLD